MPASEQAPSREDFAALQNQNCWTSSRMTPPPQKKENTMGAVQALNNKIHIYISCRRRVHRQPAAQPPSAVTLSCAVIEPDRLAMPPCRYPQVLTYLRIKTDRGLGPSWECPLLETNIVTSNLVLPPPPTLAPASLQPNISLFLPTRSRETLQGGEEGWGSAGQPIDRVLEIGTEQ